MKIKLLILLAFIYSYAFSQINAVEIVNGNTYTSKRNALTSRLLQIRNDYSVVVSKITINVSIENEVLTNDIENTNPVFGINSFVNVTQISPTPTGIYYPTNYTITIDEPTEFFFVSDPQFNNGDNIFQPGEVLQYRFNDVAVNCTETAVDQNTVYTVQLYTKNASNVDVPLGGVYSPSANVNVYKPKSNIVSKLNYDLSMINFKTTLDMPSATSCTKFGKTTTPSF